MKFQINSRKLGREIEFFAQKRGGYIYVDLNNQPGALGCQICDGGNLSGKTITAWGDFPSQCRRWWAAYLANERKNY